MGLSIVVINLLHVIVGEQVPTYMGIERARQIARWFAPIHWVWTKLMWPVIWLSDYVTKGILRAFGVDMSRSWMNDEAQAEPSASGQRPRAMTRRTMRREMADVLRRGGVPRDRRKQVVAALEIGELEVAGIMVPRQDIVALRTVDDFATNLRRIEQTAHTRYLLVDETLDQLRGTIYTAQLIGRLEALRSGRLSWADVAHPVLRIGRATSVSAAIDTMQSQKQELAAVVEDDGSLVGVVTTTDAFEAIVDELEDPKDALRRPLVAQRTVGLGQ